MLDHLARQDTSTPPPTAARPLSRGEVGFLWWFIQGSIMNGEVREGLRRSWGLCDRHTCAWLGIEAAFRHGFLHGPTILYGDLLERALAAFDVSGPLRERRLARRLRAGPCHLCALEVGPDADGFVSQARLRTGRDVGPLRRFMTECRPHWEDSICGRCSGDGPARCRFHLVEDIEQGRAPDIDSHRRHVRGLAQRLAGLERSFCWEHRGSDTAAERAALIAAAGWCGGWRGLLDTVGGAQ
jgi:hypothetical protein